MPPTDARKRTVLVQPRQPLPLSPACANLRHMLMLEVPRTPPRLTKYVVVAILAVTGSLYAEGNLEALPTSYLLMNASDIEAGYMPFQLTENWKRMTFSDEWNTHLVPSPDQGLFALRPTTGQLHSIDHLMDSAFALPPDTSLTWEQITDLLSATLIAREYSIGEESGDSSPESYELFNRDPPQSYHDYPQGLDRAIISSAWFVQMGKYLCGSRDPVPCLTEFANYFRSRYRHDHTDHPHDGDEGTHSHSHGHIADNHDHTHKHRN